MTLQEHINHLFDKYLQGTCSPEEWEELLVLVSSIPEEDTVTLSAPLYELWLKSSNKDNANSLKSFDKEKLYHAIIQSEQRDARPVIQLNWWKIAAAAMLTGVIVTAAIMYLGKESPGKQTLALNNMEAAQKVKPGIQQAVLTLANGQEIVLDSAATGMISQQGNVKIINLNGQLAYEGGNAGNNSKAGYNMVTTAKANQYQLILRDGTKVWLNAASSIKFPTSFIESTRTVEITGEAYFEVAKDKTKPFHVLAKGIDVAVLGTHFNINAYDDEAEVKTSLLEGSVKITAGNQAGQLSPGEAANYNKAGQLSIAPAKVDQSVAWVNGYFQFDQTPLPVILRQIGRWYDLEIVYEGKVPDRIFKGKIQRSLPLSSILKILRSGDIQFRLEGKRLVIVG